MRSEQDRHMDPRQRQSPDNRDGLQGQYEKDAWPPDAPRYAREFRGRRAAAGGGYELLPEHRSERNEPYEPAPNESERRVERRYPPGPKGYQRSDERLREVISERLMEASHIDSSEVTVAVSGAKVVLEGTVPERRMKHAIEDLADACPGVLDVENRILLKR
ncbi:MAG TPA: BON domain-containing protein [Steroidobacteraceae bacterium]